MDIGIHNIDLGIIVIYIVCIVGLGLWAGLRRKKGCHSKDYFLAGASLTWPVIGLSLFATNISTVHLVSLAEEGYRNGLAYGSFEWMAAFTLIALALFFAPFYIRSRVTTLPDFLEKRYSKASRNWLAILSIVSAVFIHIGFSIYAGAVVLRGMFGFNLLFSIITISVITALYTAVGGLMAVVLTESVQTIILLLGAVCLTAIAYFKIGGWSGLADVVDPVKLTVLRPSGDPSGLPWYSVLLGYPIIGIWYWCTDQTIVQRVLGAKNENHARVGPLFTGFIKILPVFIFVLPGLLCLGLIRQGKLPDEIINSADTYAFMIKHLLPIGVKGLVAAALLAALMSTVSGALNSTATLFCYDLYKQWRPETSERKLIQIGRIVTWVAMLLAVLWSPFLGRFKTIFQGINAIISYIAPPITVVFVAGVFWKKATAKASILTLISGSMLGLIVFLLDWFREYTHWNIPFLMSGFYLACLCLAILIGISLYRPQPLSAEQQTLVWNHPSEVFQGNAWKGLGNYKLLSVVLLVVMVLLYIVF